MHLRWEGRTGERLSPSSFGKRILPVVKELQEPKSAERKAHRSNASHDSRDSQDVRPLPNGNSATSNGVSINRQRMPDSLEAQRADINRIDAAVGHLQGEVSQMRSLLHDLRREVHNREPRTANGSGDTTLDALSDHVSRIGQKTGEIEGLRFELTALKGKFRRMEEASGIPTTPSQVSASFSRPEPAPMQRVSSQQQHQDIAPRGWNAVNASKRKSIDAESHASYADPSKRPRSEYRTTSGESNPAFSAQPSSASTIGAPPPQQQQAPPPVLAPIRSNSQESWHPDSQRLPPLHGMHQSGRVRPPRLAQQASQELGAPEWERESWNQEERTGPDGYYRPMGGAGPGPAPISPGASKRGGMIRRGTGGGPLQYIDPAPAKRTRQRPVRNEHGVLIRKDGKPDQRSISSPQNLRKVHERRMAEQERGSQGSPHSPSSPADPDAPHSFASDESAGPSSKSESPPPEQLPRHEQVMSRMFPDGVATDVDRMNHAAHIFQSESRQHHEARTRGEMTKEEMHEEYGIARPKSPETASHTVAGREEQASGSVYEPSQTQDESRTGEGVKPEASADNSGLVRVLSSDERPLRPRNKDVERVQEEASGSFYQPSQETSTPA